MKIRLVEDEAFLRKLLDQLLTATGHLVVASAGLLDPEPDDADIAVIDSTLNGLTGEIVEGLRTAHPNIRIVVIGLPYPGTTLGADDIVLPRPAEAAAILEAVEVTANP